MVEGGVEAIDKLKCSEPNKWRNFAPTTLESEYARTQIQAEFTRGSWQASLRLRLALPKRRFGMVAQILRTLSLWRAKSRGFWPRPKKKHRWQQFHAYPKRRFWNDEQQIECGFSIKFSAVRSPKSSTHDLEKCFEIRILIFCSSFQNLRLGSIACGRMLF